MKLLIKIIPLLLCIVTICACDINSDTTESDQDYLPLNDKQYPYAGVPRFVIETEKGKSVSSRKKDIPARLQIYDKTAPTGEIFDITIRCRGNTSFLAMPKKSYKIEFQKKQAMLGMPANKDWALIANYGDKTHLKNHITYKLATWLKDEYAPRTEFVELYLNRSYMGLYLLTETIKVGSNRVNIPQTENSYLLEINPTPKEDNTYFEIDGTTFEIHYPNHISEKSYDAVTTHIKKWSEFLKNASSYSADSISKWLDIEDFVRYYWIQEVAKNLDAAFHRSVYFTWQKNSRIKLGPVWDFDQSYGNWIEPNWQGPDGWPIRSKGWVNQLLLNKEIMKYAVAYWDSTKSFYKTLPDSISKYAKEIEPAAENDFKRWPILESTESLFHKESYNSYTEAVDSLNSWILQRIRWIDDHK